MSGLVRTYNGDGGGGGGGGGAASGETINLGALNDETTYPVNVAQANADSLTIAVNASLAAPEVPGSYTAVLSLADTGKAGAIINLRVTINPGDLASVAGGTLTIVDSATDTALTSFDVDGVSTAFAAVYVRTTLAGTPQWREQLAQQYPPVM